MEDLTTTEKLKLRGTKYAHLNVRSLFPHLDLVSAFIEPLDPLFCAVSETWLKPSIPSILVHIPGYSLYRQDRTDPRKVMGGWYGGISEV